ncbi:hypothetical protein D6810_01355, partial [Candidatus Dojkabacteria bacterium]
IGITKNTQNNETVSNLWNYGVVPFFKINLDNTIQVARSITPATQEVTWGPKTVSGDETINGMITVLGVGNKTSLVRVGNRLDVRVEVRIENSFPQGQFGIYVAGVVNRGGTLVSSAPSNFSGNIAFQRLRQMDSILSPMYSTSISNPVYRAEDSSWDVNFYVNTAARAGDIILAKSMLVSDAPSKIYQYKNTCLPGWSCPSDVQSTQSITRNINLPNQEISFGSNLSNGPINGPIVLNTAATVNLKDMSPDEPARITYAVLAKDRACNVISTTKTINRPAPWIMTRGASNYSKKAISTRLPYFESVSEPFSGIGSIRPSLSFDSVYTSHNLVRNNLSQSGVFSSNYSDLNFIDFSSRQLNFSLIYNKLSSSSIQKINVVGDLTKSGSLSQGFNIDSNKALVNIDGNFNILSNSTCDRNLVFNVSGNLFIDPDLNRSNNSVCIFLVKGTITIGAGSTKTLSVSIDAATPSNYDIVNAILISNTEIRLNLDQQGYDLKWDGLRINGALQTRNLVNKRNLNFAANDLQPAVLIDFPLEFYEVWKDELSIKSFSIREIRK